MEVDVMLWIKRSIALLLLGVVFVVGLSYGIMPWISVYEQHMSGKAMLAKSEYSKKVLVQDAMARQESAEYLAKAEVTRAEGVAKANKIIGQSLNNNEAYLHYLWIHNLEEGNHDVVYVPTESNLPLFTEAGSRFHKRQREIKTADDPGHPEHPETESK